MPTDDALADLADLALGGDRGALEELCRELQGPMFRFALRILGRPEDASDAMQEILLLIATHLSQFRRESALTAWAYTLATRHLLRRKKRLQRVRTVEVLETQIRQGMAITEASSAPEGEARVLEIETRMGCTNAMLQCLSVEERVALVLDELGADDDLASRLSGVSPAAHRKRLSRAKQKLRPILEELCGLAGEDNPCRCSRQARAKQIAGIETTTYRNLPMADRQDLERAHAGLGALRRIGPVFGAGPLLEPAEDVWFALRSRLPTLLGGAR